MVSRLTFFLTSVALVAVFLFILVSDCSTKYGCTHAFSGKPSKKSVKRKITLLVIYPQYRLIDTDTRVRVLNVLKSKQLKHVLIPDSQIFLLLSILEIKLNMFGC